MGRVNFEGGRDVPLQSMGTLCCYLCKNGHSNATRAPITNPPSSAQLGASPITPQVTSGSVQQWACGRRQTDTQTRVTTVGLHFAKCNKGAWSDRLYGTTTNGLRGRAHVVA